MTNYIGEIAAFSTALCWTFGSQMFEAAGKRVGSMSVNLIRLSLAFLMFVILLTIINGNPIPTNFPKQAWFWLSLSGIIGFALGDLFLFKAFVDIGPRLSMLIMTLTAPTSAILGLIFLNEKYLPLHWLGMAITLFGVALVILEKSDNKKRKRKVRKITYSGVVLALLGTIGQATGYVLSKHGMHTSEGFLDPFAATQIRVIAGTIGFMLIISFRRSWGKIFAALKHKSAMAFMFGGAFLGPFLGVSLSLMALHYISSGVSSTIMSITPILLIPSAIIIGN